MKVGVASMKVFTLRGVRMGEAGLLAGVALTEDGFDGRAIGIVRTRGRRASGGTGGSGQPDGSGRWQVWTEVCWPLVWAIFCGEMIRTALSGSRLCGLAANRRLLK